MGTTLPAVAETHPDRDTRCPPIVLFAPATATGCAASGRWPAWKNPSGEDERQLGTWLHGQRQAASQGRLSGAHREQLDTLVPGWNTWRTAT